MILPHLLRHTLRPSQKSILQHSLPALVLPRYHPCVKCHRLRRLLRLVFVLQAWPEVDLVGEWCTYGTCWVRKMLSGRHADRLASKRTS